jgi:hypothetical protein
MTFQLGQPSILTSHFGAEPARGSTSTRIFIAIYAKPMIEIHNRALEPLMANQSRPLKNVLNFSVLCSWCFAQHFTYQEKYNSPCSLINHNKIFISQKHYFLIRTID